MKEIEKERQKDNLIDLVKKNGDIIVQKKMTD